MIINQPKSAIEFNLSILPQISEICEPLNNINITCFGMVRIFNDGKWLVIGNHQEWITNFIEKIQKNPNYIQTIEDELACRSKYVMYGNSQKDLEIESYREMHSYNLWNGLNIYNIQPNFIEYYYILSKPEIEQMNNFYLNNLETLEKFTKYFKYKITDLINLNTEKSFINIDKIINTENVIHRENNKIKKFLKEISL